MLVNNDKLVNLIQKTCMCDLLGYDNSLSRFGTVSVLKTTTKCLALD